MTTLAGLIIVIIVSFLIIKVGSIALRMTGVDKESANFQSLSAFTGTGFTTYEAEEVVNYHNRRRIIKILMLLGNAGIISIITMLILAFSHGDISETAAKLGLLGIVILGIIIFSVVRGLETFIDNFIAKRLARFTQFSMSSFHEMLRLAHGYGVAEIVVPKGHELAGKRLFESNLRENEILVLAVKRDSVLIPAPKADELIEPEDRLICFGMLKNISAAVQIG
ncbi:MAG TPA: potassium transporter TrkA [Candidatus Eisenbacteria bacterium]|uniref:Potassium transporter TrkA n=1 Tax=Eiseniibacteriota bacterium TaxID=2212470 RepID=A0A7V2AU54_UNCEI|nr:potassium transporter TrkA [Candidatus Eisenbacteria bacterium]